MPVAFVDRMKSIFDCVCTSAAVLICFNFSSQIRPMLSVAMLSPFNASWLASVHRMIIDPVRINVNK